MSPHKAVTLALVASAGFVATLRGQEQKINRSDLPAAVERTVAAQAHGATIREFSKEVEDGHTSYEVALTVNGHGKDISMDSTGTITEVEEQVVFDSLPAAVRAGLTAKAGNGRIGTVESLTKAGKLVAYEAHVTTNDKRSEIQVGPDGKPLAHEE